MQRTYKVAKPISSIGIQNF